MSERRLRLGVIGCGKVAQNVHLPALAKSSRCELVAVCDSSPVVANGVGQRYGIDRIYGDVGAVLRDPRVEAVLVAVGDPLHVAVTLQALEAGKHVLVEKPLGVTAAECAPLREAVERRGLVLQVGVMKRCDPALEYARAAIAELGQVRSFSIWYRACADAYVNETSVFLPVIRDPAYARPAYKLDREPYYLAGHGAHLFDSVRYLFGDPVSVAADRAVHDDSYAWHGVLRLDHGGIGDFDLGVYVESDWSEGFDAYTARGSVHGRSPNPFFLRPSTVRVFEAASKRWREPVFREGDPYLRQLDAFAASVLDGAPVVATLEDGISALELIEAVARSVVSGTRIAVTHG